MQRVLNAAPSVTSITFYNGETATDSSTDVTVEVINDNGDTLEAAGTATSAGAGGDGKYDFQLTPTHTADLDVLTLNWSATIGGQPTTLSTQVEVVGGFYFTLAEARASDAALASTSTYTTANIAEARRIVEDECEACTGVAWVPRYAKATTLSGTGGTQLLLPHVQVRAVRSVVDADAAYTWTSGELDAVRVAPGGILAAAGTGYRTFTAGNRNLTVVYEHGFDRPPADLKRAALIRLKSVLFANQSGIPDRATSIATDVGTFTLATAGRGEQFTGIPEVDAAYNRHSHRVPAIA